MASSQQAKTEELHAVIDMGSNGIRFSITDLSFPTTRVLPTVFQDRCGISLFDAQYRHGSKIPIPDQTIEEILQALASFKRTCGDFAVQRANIQLVATEATRNAINSTDFLRRIEYEIGWKPRLLSKEDEGLVASSHIRQHCLPLVLVILLWPAMQLISHLRRASHIDIRRRVVRDVSDLVL